jgi:hypothetical protein
MTGMKLTGVAVAALLASTTVGTVPQQPSAQRAQGVVQTGVQAVLVDVVVHDRKGEPVRDLTENDFRITEDGVPQKIGAFNSIVEGARPSAVATPQPSAPTIGSAAPVRPRRRKKRPRAGAAEQVARVPVMRCSPRCSRT